MEYQYTAYVDDIGDLDVALESSDNILVRTWKWIVDKITSFFKWVGDQMAKFYRWLTGKSKKTVDTEDIVKQEEAVTGKPKDEIKVQTESTAKANQAVHAKAIESEKKEVADAIKTTATAPSKLNVLSGVDDKKLEQTVTELWKEMNLFLNFTSAKGLDVIGTAVDFGEAVTAYKTNPGMSTIKALSNYRGTLAKTSAVTDVYTDICRTLSFTPTADLAKLFGVASPRDLTLVHIADGFIKAGDIAADKGVDLDKQFALHERGKVLPKNLILNNLVLITGIVTGAGVINVPDALVDRLEGRTTDYLYQTFNQLVGTRVVELYKELSTGDAGKGFIPNGSGEYYCYATRSNEASLNSCIEKYKDATRKINGVSNPDGFAKVSSSTMGPDPKDILTKGNITIGQVIALYDMYSKQLKGVREESRLGSEADFIKHFTSTSGPINDAVMSKDQGPNIQALINVIIIWVGACNQAIMKHMADITTIHADLTTIFERKK
jgi:hypothetical protein